ncbi:MAG TPA: superoxide dismutase family protein, partial [Chitinophagaceae bacterium]|nr:superoxide dismutase family protein [Chitinophagaceae bacterium]
MKLLSFSKLALCTLAVGIIGYSCNNENAGSDQNADTSTTTSETSHADMNMAGDTATVALVDKAEAVLTGTYPDTTLSGTAKFETVSDGKVKMNIEITVAAKAGKEVAVHIHEHGDCSDNGKMAHGHWNPTNAQHGK